MAKITKTFVDGCTPADKDRIEWDDDLKGFGIKVFVTGTKSFIFDYRNPEGTKRRVTIGKLSTALTPDQARKRAIELYRQVLNGGDPMSEVRKRREAWTVDQLLDAYLASPAFADKADSTRPIDIGRINHHLRPLLGNRFADQITPDDIKRARTAIPQERPPPW